VAVVDSLIVDWSCLCDERSGPPALGLGYRLPADSKTLAGIMRMQANRTCSADGAPLQAFAGS
jgi:hypothetical protein